MLIVLTKITIENMNPLTVKEIATLILSFIEIKGSANFANVCKLWNSIHRENIKIKCYGELKEKMSGSHSNLTPLDLKIDESLTVIGTCTRMLIKKSIYSTYDDSPWLIHDFRYCIYKEFKSSISKYISYIVEYDHNDIENIRFYVKEDYNIYTSFGNYADYIDIIDMYYT